MGRSSSALGSIVYISLSGQDMNRLCGFFLWVHSTIWPYFSISTCSFWEVWCHHGSWSILHFCLSMSVRPGSGVGWQELSSGSSSGCRWDYGDIMGFTSRCVLLPRSTSSTFSVRGSGIGLVGVYNQGHLTYIRIFLLIPFERLDFAWKCIAGFGAWGLVV